MDNEHHRKSDDLLTRMDQRLTDHLKADDQRWINLNDRLKPLEDLNKKLDTPLRILMWAMAGVTIIVVSALVEICVKFGKWFIANIWLKGG